jgi:riboflavin kinase/FMN adenylyltransferase
MDPSFIHEVAMQILRNARDFAPAGAVVSVGMYDGVHRGHRRVLQQLRQRGGELGLPSVVVTFDPHPRAVLRPDAAPRLLMSLEQRLELLALTGAVDHCLVLPFDRQASEMSAHDFVARTLVEQLGLRALVVGENFRCGKGRMGDIALLRTMGTALGFTVHPVALKTASEPMSAAPCSSTEMRRLIESGDIVAAAAGLTRPHEMRGTVSRVARGAGQVLELSLAPGLCTPAPRDYAGAVRHPRATSPWVPALLQVRPAGAVRLVATDPFPAARGDVLALRFLNRSPS